MSDYPKRYEIWMVKVDSMTEELKKRCVVISPNEMNLPSALTIVAPLTESGKHYPTRVAVRGERGRGAVALEQLRSIRKGQFIKRIGALSEIESRQVARVLTAMFSF